VTEAISAIDAEKNEVEDQVDPLLDSMPAAISLIPPDLGPFLS